MNRFIVMFDASPGSAPNAWMKQAAEQTGLFVVDPDEIAQFMGKDPEARHDLLNLKGKLPDPVLSPHFQRAFNELTQGKERVALPSFSWIVYGLKPDAAIYSFDQVNNPQEYEKARQSSLPAGEYDKHVAFIKKAVLDLVAQVPADRRLECKGTDAQKATLAAQFIRSKQPR